METFVTFDEAAELLGVSRESIRLYVQRGLLVEGQIYGKRKVVRASVEALLNQHFDVVRQAREVEALREELTKEKAEISEMRKALSTKKSLLALKGKVWDNYDHICNAMVAFVAESGEDVGLALRERQCVERLLKGASLDDLAEDFGLTRERIRQIYIKALKKIQIMSKLPQALAENTNLKREVENLKFEREDLMRAIKDQRKIEQLKDTILIPESLIGLKNTGISVRAYNCLKALGFDHLYQLTFVSMRQLQRCRNLGRKTIDELDRLMDLYNLEFDNPQSLKDVRLPNKEQLVSVPWSNIVSQQEVIKRLWR